MPEQADNEPNGNEANESSGATVESDGGSADIVTSIETSTDAVTHRTENEIVPMTLHDAGKSSYIVSTILWVFATKLLNISFLTYKEPIFASFSSDELKAALKIIQEIAKTQMTTDDPEVLKTIGGKPRNPCSILKRIHEVITLCTHSELPTFLPGTDVSRIINNDLNNLLNNDPNMTCSGCRAMEKRMDNLENLIQKGTIKRCVEEELIPIKNSLKSVDEEIARLDSITSAAYRSPIISKQRTVTNPRPERAATTTAPGTSPNTRAASPTKNNLQQSNTHPHSLQPLIPPTKTTQPATPPSPTTHFRKPSNSSEAAFGLLGVDAEFPRTNDPTKAPSSKQDAGRQVLQAEPIVPQQQDKAREDGANYSDKKRDPEGDTFQKVNRRKKKKRKYIIGNGLKTTPGAFPTQRSSMYVSIYGKITADRIMNEIRRQTECGSYQVETLQRPGRFSAFKVTGPFLQIRRLLSPELWPDGARIRKFHEGKKSGEAADKHSYKHVSR